MKKTEFNLPTLITTSVVRGSQQGESHGGIYLINFAEQSVDQVVDWDTSEIDFTGRGWDRGLRGIAFFAGEIYIAASDELFVYDQNFKIQRSFRSSYLKHCHGMFVSGMHPNGIFRIGDNNVVAKIIDLPAGTHNSRPFRDGVLFNDTAANIVRYVSRDGSGRNFQIPQFQSSQLTHTELGDESVARQGFGRGLCVINDNIIAAGSSPSTVTLYDLETGSDITQVNFSMDIRNAVHGLEVWPFS